MTTTKLAPSEIKKTDRRKLWSFFDKNNTKHSYILSLCIQYGWSKEHPKTGKEVADLGALDRWLKGKNDRGNSPVQMPLEDMSPLKLSIVIVALENMVQGKHTR